MQEQGWEMPEEDGAEMEATSPIILCKLDEALRDSGLDQTSHSSFPPLSPLLRLPSLAAR